MRRRWGWAALGLAVVILGLIGLREYSLRKEVELKTENQYQRAFQEVVYHVDSLADELTKAAVSGSYPMTQKALADAWRHTESARSGLGQLPIGTIELSTTEDFLSQVASFTYTLSQRGESGSGLSDREWAILGDLRREATFAAEELTNLGGAIASRRLRWIDVQRESMATAAMRPEREKTQGAPSNQVTKGLKMLEDGMTRFPTPDFEGVIPPPRKKLPGIPGPEISTDDAILIAMKFAGYSIQEGARGEVIAKIASEPESYRVEITPPRGPVSKAWADVSVRGGRVLWMYRDSPIGPETITPAIAVDAAKAFLASHGFQDMREISRRDYQGVSAIGFAYEQNGVVIYPDYVVVRVALDDGLIDGFEGTNYQIFHRVRPLKEPGLSEAEARERLNPRLTVIGSRLAVILDDFYQEKLVYEFRCKLEKDTYLVYVNAETGEEEEVKKAGTGGFELV
ncbi:MAG: germination protein YpeB [Firmicutes bacterium]|nr:germination protein YpeB [Bacillota bacterium]